MTLNKIASKRVLVRFDYNVPIYNKEIVNDFRIKQSLNTIKTLRKNNNNLIILSHLGRPKEGENDKSLSLRPICDYLSLLIGERVEFLNSYNQEPTFDGYNIAMYENTRFITGEKSCNPDLSKMLAKKGDVFVFDAFGVSHRKECTTYGISDYIDTFPGLNISHEIQTINKLINQNSRPMTIIISGAKVSTKLIVIKKLLSKCDNMILGGGILNTFLKALGYEIGNSLYEKDLVEEASKILDSALSCKIKLPCDLHVSRTGTNENVLIDEINKNDVIYDLGINTIDQIKNIIYQSNSIFWNGPLGYVEKKPFDTATVETAIAIANHKCFSIVGGGDTLPIIESLNIQNNYSCLSTGGGSLLTYIEGGSLPILEKLGIE